MNLQAILMQEPEQSLVNLCAYLTFIQLNSRYNC